MGSVPAVEGECSSLSVALVLGQHSSLHNAGMVIFLGDSVSILWKLETRNVCVSSILGVVRDALWLPKSRLDRHSDQTTCPMDANRMVRQRCISL